MIMISLILGIIIVYLLLKLSENKEASNLQVSNNIPIEIPKISEDEERIIALYLEEWKSYY